MTDGSQPVPQERRFAHLRITNESDALLEVVLEPTGRDHWMRPGEEFVITTVSDLGPGVWSGTTYADEPFEVDWRSGQITVHCNGGSAWVCDAEGNEIECGHQRP